MKEKTFNEMRNGGEDENTMNRKSTTSVTKQVFMIFYDKQFRLYRF